MVSTSKLITVGGIGFAGLDAESKEKYKLSGVISILFSNKLVLPPTNVFVVSTLIGIKLLFIS